MSAIILQKAEQENKTVCLYEQLGIGILQKSEIAYIESYLLQKKIYDVTLMEEHDFRELKRSLYDSGEYTKKVSAEIIHEMQKMQDYWIKKEYGELLNEIECCAEARKAFLWNIKRFLIRQGIHHVREIDYTVREKYEQEQLAARSYESGLAYLKAFDKIKQYHIQKEMSNLSGMARNRLIFSNQIIFLPYLPEQELAMEFDKVQDKKELVWDFRQPASDMLKRQVFTLLMYILENMRADPKERRVRFLLPLQWLYEYCVTEKIEDIELLELQQIDSFEKVVAKKVANFKNSMQIVDNSRKILFLCAKEIRWEANVWYMERFHVSPERKNPSNPVVRMTFYEVTNKKIRPLLQEYARYLVGITDLTLNNIRGQIYDIKKFLEHFAEYSSILQITEEHVDSYFAELREQDVKAETFNKKITSIWKFYQYLKVKNKIKIIPFELEYHLQKEYPVHHERSVEETVCMELLNKLYLFPETSRLIFLHLWCTGLRISEICTLKGNAYYWEGEDAWIKVYQIKMKADKMIPIPLVLYSIMRKYIQKNRIKAKSYIFKGVDGGAYRVGSFIKTFKAHCLKNGIANSDYVFKSHDYRHTLATRFHDDGVSLQTIRDYLGHHSENMTKQYIDYMPKKVAEANREYFEKPENNLAATIQVGKHGEKNEK